MADDWAAQSEVQRLASGEELADLFGMSDPRQARLADDVLRALHKVAPELVPSRYAHPLEALIFKGPSAFSLLISKLRHATSEPQRAGIVDAIAEIIRLSHATPEVVAALRETLSQSRSSLVVSIAARALALARDEGFLAQQRDLLASSRLTQVRTAARLLGFGKDERAVPTLLALLRPDNAAVVEAVVWALGEIGDESALPLLHAMLNEHVYASDVLRAIGKIGHQTSLPHLITVLTQAGRAARETGAQAVVRLLARSGGEVDVPELRAALVSTLNRCAERDASRVVRFYVMVALAMLGTSLTPALLRRVLCTDLTQTDFDAISMLVARRAAPRTGAAGRAA